MVAVVSAVGRRMRYLSRPHARKAGRRVARFWRVRVTSRLRPLPDFVVIGAQKSGSTSLHHYLAQHPETLPSRTKEVRFFDAPERYSQGEAWYRAQFPLRRAGRPQLAFESTADYLFHPQVPERMHRLVADARLVAVLRNPTERAISGYLHERRRGREMLPIEAALCLEDARVGIHLANGEFDHPAVRHFAYLRRGHYADQLERFFAFFPRDRVLVLRSEDMFADPHHVAQAVTGFLGISSMAADVPFPWLNTRGTGREDAAVGASTRDRLDTYYAPHNRKLEALLGRPMGWPT